MMTSEETTDKVEDDIDTEALSRGITLFVVSIIVLVSFSSLIFYSTLRSKCIGLATGYIKAIELGYQRGEFNFKKDFSEESFETGFYKVIINLERPKDQNSMVLKIKVKDKFLSLTHYSEELKLIPLPESEL